MDVPVTVKGDEESKRKGARSLAAYMQLSDAVFTPYAESLYPSSGGEGEARKESGWWGYNLGRGGGGRRRTTYGRGSEEVGQPLPRAYFANAFMQCCFFLFDGEKTGFRVQVLGGSTHKHAVTRTRLD